MSNKVQTNMIIITKSITVIRDTIVITENLIIRNTKTMTKNQVNTPNIENIRIIITTSVIQDTQNSDL